MSLSRHSERAPRRVRALADTATVETAVAPLTVLQPQGDVPRRAGSSPPNRLPWRHEQERGTAHMDMPGMTPDNSAMSKELGSKCLKVCRRQKAHGLRARQHVLK